jgi:methyl coenzyme M reductase alpha subunit
VKTEIAKVCALLAGLIAIAAAQDMSGTVFGVKPPLLLVFGCFAGVPASVGAGLFADALGGMPFGCSAIIFAAAALSARALRRSAFLIAAVAAAIYELWLSTWGGAGGFAAIATAAGMACIASPVMSFTLAIVKKRIGLDNTDEGETV